MQLSHFQKQLGLLTQQQQDTKGDIVVLIKHLLKNIKYFRYIFLWCSN